MSDISNASGRIPAASFLRGTIWLIALLMLLGGCALPQGTQQRVACGAHESSWVRETLYFGTKRAHGGEVDVAQWAGFERDVLLLNFPQGYTVLAGTGHWRDSNGVASDEAVHIVVIDHADDAAALQRVVADYRSRFDQQAVLQERSPVCVSFHDGA
jgi:hypothetical protein